MCFTLFSFVCLFAQNRVLCVYCVHKIRFISIVSDQSVGSIDQKIARIKCFCNGMLNEIKERVRTHRHTHPLKLIVFFLLILFLFFFEFLPCSSLHLVCSVKCRTRKPMRLEIIHNTQCAMAWHGMVCSCGKINEILECNSCRF